ncbi:MAG: hypothetical protein ACJATI_005040 [Halioglobus sp.]|jgi:hypothetical protein
MKRIILLFILALLTFDTNAQECGSHKPQSSNSILCNYPETGYDITIPVYFHFAASTFNNADLDQNEMNALISDLNTAFSYNNLGTQYSINFVLAAFDEKGNCFNGSKTHNLNGNAYKFYKDSHDNYINEAYPDNAERDFVVTRYLNLWCVPEVHSGTNGENQIGGYSSFPPSINNLADNIFPSIFLNLGLYDEETTPTHEVGHFFGLFHVFTGGCIINTEDTCSDGDLIESTPSCHVLTGQSCNTSIQTCNNDPYPYENFMSYGANCRTEFVAEQFHRIGAFISEYNVMYSQSNLNWTLEQGNQPSDYSGNVTLNSDISGGTKTVSANSTLTINGNVTFSNVDFIMGTNSKIVVPDGSSLTINGGSTFEVGCISMWEGIEVLGNATISTSGGTKINDAYRGIYIVSNATLSCVNTHFINCYIGIQFGDSNQIFNQFLNSPTITAFRGNKFLSNRPVLYNKQGISNLNLERTWAGVFGINCNYLSFVGNANTNDFNNTSFGYMLFGTHFEITSSTFKNCNNGIFSYSSFGLNKIATIKANNFEAVNNCINLSYSMPFISDNTFGIENNVGIKLRHTSGPSFLVTHITNNICEDYMRTRAIDIGGAQGLYVINNTFLSINDENEAIKNSIGNSRDVTFINNVMSPINIINCEDSLFEENSFDLIDEVSNILGGYNNTFSCNFFTSLYVEASPKAIYSCNEFDTDLDVDLQFLNNNVFSELIANKLNSSEIGLLLSGDGDTQIGLQIDNGNLWSGTFSDKGAKASLNVDPQLSRFIVRNINQEYPSHEPAAFFINNSNKDPESCIGPNECQGGEPGAEIIPTWIGEDHGINCLDSLVNGSQFNNISSEGKWVALYILVKLQLLNENHPAQLSDCFQEIMDQYEDSDEDKLIKAIRLIEHNNADFTALPMQNILTAIQINTTNQIQETFDLANINTIKNYMADVEIWNHANLITSNQNQAYAISSLNSISSSEPGILHLQNILPIYVKWINGVTLSNLELSTINSIANTCSSVGSFAKYIAMGIEVSYGGAIVKEDENGCNSKIRNGKPLSNLKDEVVIYPNPSSGMFNVVIAEGARIELADKFGNILYKDVFEKGENRINLEGYPTGIYFLHTISETGNKNTEMLLKI